MDEAQVTWPSLHPLRHQHLDATNQLVEQPSNPTWPAPLQPLSDHGTPQPQPNLYFQLSQILECEIWNHNQTRSGLCSELARRTELEAQVWKLNNELAQWQESSRVLYAALDEHRAQNSNLKLDIEALTDELRHLRQLRPNAGLLIAPKECREPERAKTEVLLEHRLPPIKKENECLWRLGGFQEAEQHENDSE